MFQQVLNGMAMNMPSSADDYEKDGLLYCGKCNTPKQTFIEGFGRNMPVPCKCRKEQEQAEKEREELLKKQARINSLRNSSLLGVRYRNATFENTETEHSIEFAKIYNRCQRYCEVADAVLKNGTGIFLFGTNGTGKTRLTACMGNELMQNNYTVLFTNFAEITKRVFKDDEFIEKLAKIEFLFIDDFGTEKVTKGSEDLWMQEKVFEVVNKRYNECKPIIFSSNYSLKELIEDRGVAKKTIDRIAEMCEVLKLNGESYRLTAMRKREKLF